MTDDRAALERDGFVVLDAPDGLTELDLGRCLHVQEVRVRPTSRSLVCSRRALGPHTDHHAARWVVLRCIEPAARGGRSLLIDGGAVVAELPRDMREALRRVVLREHDVFGTGTTQHPLLGPDDELYYSYWLAGSLAGLERAAFDAFAARIRRAPRVERTLRRGQTLVVDNHRMLHGRTAFSGDRHLVRRWYAPTG
ncbi:MAG TPA: TauD/TfdA family dioxygenase [Polyangiaceae bacterium LLY-WYZ-15_(1-7)]|nr:TauD/TfdA family dioxygenase [Polyangiaceae bacterium LLY-WYZ-15_(1-7)]HJL02394.1 TauD/TfdA family dioxygenase [Polyangiaceae bacterium LLY-WYZ-15_(1-7)]HJL11684.1 TauD/TfdA family dioxygenase [Polyangiaceae bacterium LLY-WYZ-15_(1-7)]HJL21252.1 TauD/TfdA family dioxygenase [Polyangiaceae bacterium LLY-WYZ-15_(1-7)]HJL27946.1 TauD/TfdA family dioxygenase [Polyangiaceae bacterium LLY-WYZ-15_(1-7)]